MTTHQSLGFTHVYQPGSAGTGWTVLALHGTGGDEQDLLPLAEAIAPGWGVLSPRGKVSEYGANRFFRRLREGVFDLEDLRARTDELADFIAAAAEHYGFDADKVLAIGFSNGANVAANLLLQRPESLAAAVLIRPMIPQEPPAAHDLSEKKVLILAGEHDSVTPHGLAIALREALTAMKANVEFQLLPSGHGLTQADVLLAGQFVEQL